MRFPDKIKLLIMLFFFCSQAFAAQLIWRFKPSDVNQLHSNPPNQHLFYGKGKQQFGDLRLPFKKGPYPVAIIIHGGCWLSQYAQVQYTAALSDALRDLGFATWNIEYRQEDLPGGGYPGTFFDIANGADYLRKIAKKYALDLKNVIVIGHSAGGHLALWLAARHNLPTSSPLHMKNPLRLRGVLSMAAPADLAAFQTFAKKICGNIDVVNRLRPFKDTSPIELLPLHIRQTLIFGNDDPAVPFKFSQAYIKSAKQKGDRVRVILMPGTGHHEYCVPNSMTWPAVRAAVLELVS